MIPDMQSHMKIAFCFVSAVMHVWPLVVMSYGSKDYDSLPYRVKRSNI